MFRLFPSHHQGACYIVEWKNNGYIFKIQLFTLVFFSLNLLFVKIINTILKMLCCLTLLCNKIRRESELGYGVDVM
jgi:hypothetical protein